jgi:hypothetical protein
MPQELAQASEGDVASAFESAFGSEPPEAPAATDPLPADLLPEDAAPVEEPEEEEAAPEPSFEIEVDGAPEVIQGADKIKEILQRGVKAGRVHEDTARVREALVAQAKSQQEAAQIQGALMADIAELRALDHQLEQWNRVDWNAAFDADPFQALKLREQRDALREQRNVKHQEISSKHEQFTRGQQQLSAERARAEMGAFLAKVPEWRNAEKASAEKQAIVRGLESEGFTAEEIGSLVDHRMLRVARKAMLYDELVRTKDDRVKQVRTAPPVVKPGTQAGKTQSGKADFVKVRSHLRQLGAKGNHKAQEDIVTEMFTRTFK